MPHGFFCHGRQERLSEQKKIRPPVTDFTACRHLFVAHHASRCLAPQPNITPRCRAHLLVRFCDCSANNSADKVHMCLHYFYHWISTRCEQKCRMQTKTQILADACAREGIPCAHNAKAYAQVCFQRHKNASYERKCVTSPKINRCVTVSPTILFKEQQNHAHPQQTA